MPLYEYECRACEAQFEVLVRSVGSDPQPACPVCGAAQARRLISLVAARPSRGDEPGAAPTLPRATGGGCCGGACGCGH